MMFLVSQGCICFSDLNFLVTADWGGIPVWPWVTPAQLRVAHAMGVVAERTTPRFAITLGDHFCQASGIRTHAAGILLTDECLNDSLVRHATQIFTEYGTPMTRAGSTPLKTSSPPLDCKAPDFGARSRATMYAHSGIRFQSLFTLVKICRSDRLPLAELVPFKRDRTTTATCLLHLSMPAGPARDGTTQHCSTHGGRRLPMGTAAQRWILCCSTRCFSAACHGGALPPSPNRIGSGWRQRSKHPMRTSSLSAAITRSTRRRTMGRRAACGGG